MIAWILNSSIKISLWINKLISRWLQKLINFYKFINRDYCCISSKVFPWSIRARFLHANENNYEITFSNFYSFDKGFINGLRLIFELGSGFWISLYLLKIDFNSNYFSETTWLKISIYDYSLIFWFFSIYLDKFLSFFTYSL